MEREVIGLVPAAGKGVRLSLPYPKELYPIIRDNRYKPVSQFVLDNLVRAGIRHVVFVINETKHQLIGYFGDGHRFGSEISYVVQEQNGTGSGSTSPGLALALDSAYHLVKGKTVFFGMADTIMEPPDVFAHLRAAAGDRDDVLVGLFRTQRPEKFGMVRLDKENRVLEVVDKPRVTNLVDMWGCLMWRPPFTEHLRTCVRSLGVSDFARILNEGIQAGLHVRGVRIAGGTYQDLGTYQEILELDHSSRER
jgi:glucose-1-phosphate thymidylyltransferase